MHPKVRAVDFEWRPCSDFRHVTAPCKLSHYYYCYYLRPPSEIAQFADTLVGRRRGHVKLWVRCGVLLHWMAGIFTTTQTWSHWDQLARCWTSRETWIVISGRSPAGSWLKTSVALSLALVTYSRIIMMVFVCHTDREMQNIETEQENARLRKPEHATEVQQSHESNCKAL